ncbi:MAG TPA: MgtC/SapB family protein [Ohtaekwangia sp.]|uniref:MgtC/SapB family protein n=1 Tax=Ohtaekwangia sp. TaxID=2066019 RepID=UPI002F91CC00
MHIDINSDYETALQLLLSFVIGSAIGLEREYRSKAAGLRTMIMICLGSTIFTEISATLTISTPDRIASNIITGVGFLGAGVIFKDTLTISGITTATTIWIAAALGMAVGAGEYFIAFAGSIAVIIVLTIFENVKLIITRFHQARTYRITLLKDDIFIQELEATFIKHKLRFLQDRYMKNEENYILIYEAFGGVKNFDGLNEFLKNDPRVKRYEY